MFNDSKCGKNLQVEVCGEGNEDEDDGDEETSGNPSGNNMVAIRRIELHPAEQKMRQEKPRHLMIMISTRKRRMPRTVEKPQANSMILPIFE